MEKSLSPLLGGRLLWLQLPVFLHYSAIHPSPYGLSGRPFICWVFHL
ncbi:hypothetical protein VSK92_06985 [Bacillus swezeyi]